MHIVVYFVKKLKVIKMFRKLLCKLGSHIWVVSTEKDDSSSIADFETRSGVLSIYIIEYRIFKVEKCLCCKKEKREVIETKRRKVGKNNENGSIV